MNPTNRYGILPRVAIPALALPLSFGLFSFASSKTAPATHPQADIPSSTSDALASVVDLASSGIAERVIQSSGSIEADVDLFRALLGDPNNGGTPGPLKSGRREINWDGVPAAVTDVQNFPPEFFNVNSKRGLVYSAAVSPGLEVSDMQFADINPTYAAEFNPFSGAKLFSPIGSNVSEADFLIPGSNTKASVRGFGVVFMDVDVAGSTGIILFDEAGQSLGRILAPVRSDARGASFVAVTFRDPRINRVVIVSGNAALSPTEKDISQGGTHDLVVMDDFLYGEPTETH
jgi:hypothetical protein